MLSFHGTSKGFFRQTEASSVAWVSKKAIGWLLVGVQIALYVVLILLPWRAPTAVSIILSIPPLILGLTVLVVSFRTLGSALTPNPVPITGAGLRTMGAYAWIRHPIYSAVLCVTLAALIFAGSWWSWLWGVVIVAFFWGKSRWEDRMLAREYGAQWQSWAARTGALIPRRRRSAP